MPLEHFDEKQQTELMADPETKMLAGVNTDDGVAKFFVTKTRK
jgi:hypothetical protein